MNNMNDKFAQILTELNCINQEELEKHILIAQKSDISLIRVIRESKAIHENMLTQALSRFYELPIVPTNKELVIEENLINTIGLENVIKFNIVPLRVNKDVYIGIVEPDNMVTVDFIRSRELTVNVKYCIITPEIFNTLASTHITPKIMSNKIESSFGKLLDETSSSDINEDNSDIGSVILLMLTNAAQMRASDIHMQPLEKSIEVSYRIDGKKQVIQSLPKKMINPMINKIIALCRSNATTISRPVDGKFSFVHQQNELFMRVSLIPTKMGVSINMRFTDSNTRSIEDIGFDMLTLEKYKRLLNLTKGLVLIVGPSGSGKSTTLDAGLRIIAEQSKNVLTVEDPVENIIPNITQVDIQDGAMTDKKFVMGFTDVIKAFMRHDPDTIKVGEIRDLEVAKETFRTAGTGHLVFSTLHANDAISAIPRLINMGVSPYTISESLCAILAQRLVRRICPHCQTTYELDRHHKYREIFQLGDEKIVLSKGIGCDKCMGTGYFSRVAITEIVMVDDNLRALIERKASRKDFKQALETISFNDFVADGVAKALEGATTLDEILPFANDLI